MHLLAFERPPVLTEFSHVISCEHDSVMMEKKKNLRGGEQFLARPSTTSINPDGNEWAYLKDAYQLALLSEWICLIKGTRCKRFYFHHCTCYLHICRPFGMNKWFPPYLSFFLSLSLLPETEQRT